LAATGKKLIIQEKAELIPGVKAVIGDLTVELPPGTERKDQEITESICHALKLNSYIPAERLELAVENGWVTIKGTVDWLHQRERSCRLEPVAQ
jgi:osmotically-inducible protein OsmY